MAGRLSAFSLWLMKAIVGCVGIIAILVEGDPLSNIQNQIIATIFRLIACSFVFASSLVSASIDPRHLSSPLPATATPTTMATTGTGTEDVSPPTKRVRMNPADIKDGTGQSDGGAGAQSSQGGPSSASRPAFLTPPASASIPAPPPSSSSDAVLTHDN